MGDPVPSNNQITVQGDHFLKDGVAWLSEGCTSAGMLCPDQTLTTFQSGMIAVSQITTAQFGNEMAASQSWGADTARFLVSQAALGPDSAYHRS